jgi:hypothetical protein
MGFKNNIQNDGDTGTEGHGSVFNRYDYELYDDEQNLVEKVFRVKKSASISKSEKWRIICNNEVVLTIEGTKLSKKEKVFLRTANGFNFLIAQTKVGIKSFNKLKIELKKAVSK